MGLKTLLLPEYKRLQRNPNWVLAGAFYCRWRLVHIEAKSTSGTKVMSSRMFIGFGLLIQSFFCLLWELNNKFLLLYGLKIKTN
ncbi:hypothetical protein TY91_12640 [Secundilactobacillus collinoides]|uniref:Uncharacterized protein n=1 Tax=Secundilactobacillus collinoides TaxID=33960 RepID=A0A166G9A5_SECCO|nr:hypothetical protein TY91_12640 [Secundilactobacillus collinoides]